MTTHYVSFSAEINTRTTEQLIAVCANLSNNKASEIVLMLSTPGGQVMSGITIYNTLRSLSPKITTYNMGNVDSIGNVIFLAGEDRYACPDSTFMFHGVGMDVQSSTRLDARTLNEAALSVEADNKRIGSILKIHSKLDDSEILDLFVETRTKDAGWAARVGIINAIRKPNIPVGVPVHSLVFNR